MWRPRTVLAPGRRDDVGPDPTWDDDVETLELGWCPTCLDLVQVADDGACPRGHTANPDLDGPPPWVGHADAEGNGATTSTTSAAPTISGNGSSASGVGTAEEREGLLDLHLAMLQEAPSTNGAYAATPPDVPTPPAAPTPALEPAATDPADDELGLDDLLALELQDLAPSDPDTDEPADEAVPVAATSLEDDLAGLLAMELGADDASTGDAPAATSPVRDEPPTPTTPPTVDVEDSLADLLAMELDESPDVPDVDTSAPDDDLADLLAMELDTPAVDDAQPAPGDDLADLLAMELETPAVDETPPAPDDDLADLLAAELDDPAPATGPGSAVASSNLMDLGDLLAAELDDPVPDDTASSDGAAPATPDWLDEPAGDRDELTRALQETLGSLDDDPAPPAREESLDDVIGDVLASLGVEDSAAAPPAAADDDLVSAADLDLTPTSAAALDDDALADLAELGLFDLDPPTPDPTPPAPTSAAPPPDDASPPPPAPDPGPAAAPNPTAPTSRGSNVDLLNFTAGGAKPRRGLRRGRKSS